MIKSYEYKERHLLETQLPISVARKTEIAIGQGDQGQQRQVEYGGECRQIPQGEFMQRNYGIKPRFPDGQGAHSMVNIGAGDQRTTALLRENDSNHMDTSEDVNTSADVSVFFGPCIWCVHIDRHGVLYLFYQRRYPYWSRLL